MEITNYNTSNCKLYVLSYILSLILKLFRFLLCKHTGHIHNEVTNIFKGYLLHT